MHTTHTKKILGVNSAQTGKLEQWAINYYHYLGRKYHTDGLRNLEIDELPADIVLQTLADNITGFAAIIAFAIGALTTFVSIWIEWTYHDSMAGFSYYVLYGSVLLVMLAIELLVLFWLSLKTVYSLACLTGYHQVPMDTILPVETSVPNILARAALELSDPVSHYLDIDPLKHLSKSKLFLIAGLYKAKVFLSSLAIRFLLIGGLGKGGSRFTFSWVGIPVTGFWDAFTLYKVAREARLRLFGHKLVGHLVSKLHSDNLTARLSPLAREGAIRAVATMMVLTQHYHPNMLILLISLSEAFDIKENAGYDDWQVFLEVLGRVEAHERYFLLDLLSISAAFEGKLSGLEKQYLPEAFQEFTAVYMRRAEQLSIMLVSGQLHAAKQLCNLDFNPG